MAPNGRQAIGHTTPRLNDLLATAAVQQPKQDINLSERARLVCTIVQIIVKQLETDARSDSEDLAAGIEQALQALLLLKNEVTERPTLLVQDAVPATEQNPRIRASQSKPELLCFWLLSRLVRLLIAAINAGEAQKERLTSHVEDAMVEMLRALCGWALAASSGMEHGRALLLEMLELCKALSSPGSATGPISYALFKLAGKDAIAGDDPFEPQADTDSRPFPLTILREAAVPVAATLLHVSSSVILPTLQADRIQGAMADSTSSLIDTTARAIATSLGGHMIDVSVAMIEASKTEALQSAAIARLIREVLGKAVEACREASPGESNGAGHHGDSSRLLRTVKAIHGLCSMSHGGIARSSAANIIIPHLTTLVQAIEADDKTSTRFAWSARQRTSLAVLLMPVSIQGSSTSPAYRLLDEATTAAVEAQLLSLQTRANLVDLIGETCLVDLIRRFSLPEPQAVSSSSRKRKRSTVEEARARPTLHRRTTSRAKEPWRPVVTTVLKERIGIAGLEGENNVEQVMLGLIDSLEGMDAERKQETAIGIGFLACAQSGGMDTSATRCECEQLDGPRNFEHRKRNLSSAPAEAVIRLLAPTTASTTKESHAHRLGLLKSLTRICSHTTFVIGSECEKLLARHLASCLRHEARIVRVASGHLFAVYARARQEQATSTDVANGLEPPLQTIEGLARKSPPPQRETAILALAKLTQFAEGELMGRSLLALIRQLSAGTPLRDVAHLHLLQLVPLRATSAYKLVSPHLDLLGPYIAEQMMQDANAPRMGIASTCASFVSLDASTFIKQLAPHLLPTIIYRRRMDVLQAVSTAVGIVPAKLCLDCLTPILVHLFLDVAHKEKERDRSLAFLVGLMDEGHDLGIIINVALVPLLVALVAQLGSRKGSRSKEADRALQQVDRVRANGGPGYTPQHAKLLTAHMLAILTHANEELNDMHGKKTLEVKRSLVRGIGRMIDLVGPDIRGVSPQVMATLQSTLRTDGLIEVTLKTWHKFVSNLRYDSISPFVGSTSAAFVREWPRFSTAEGALAKQVLEYLILNNGQNLATFVDDIVDLSDVPELRGISDVIKTQRTEQTLEGRLRAALQRVSSENDSVELQGLHDLRRLLQDRQGIASLAHGDSFSPILGHLIKTLTAAISKDGHAREDVRSLAYECIGIVGALDPDRLDMPADDPPLVVLRNFTDSDETIDFCIALIKNVLVGAYRSSVDTRHQKAIAFAIQELLKLCGFTKAIADAHSDPRKARSRLHDKWHALPPSVHETIGPLLDCHLVINRGASQVADYPFFSSVTSYRDWLKSWTLALIHRCRHLPSGRVFKVFESAVKHSDVGLTRQLLPHILLSVIVGGDRADREAIRSEFDGVLSDQLDPRSQLSQDSRYLCAQAVFDLMDHVAHFARRCVTLDSKKRKAMTAQEKQEQKTREKARRDADSLTSSVPRDLQARAALERKAYPRSLLNFESIVRDKKAQPMADTQRYYELMHRIYAELDEPDGMEGISTLIVAPSVWTQIREHESIGRWTSAQSCWEVQLQLEPDHPRSHVGLLKCLRNLGHYDSMRTHIVGVLQQHPDWRSVLAPFEVESALISGDRIGLRHALAAVEIDSAEISFGRVMSALLDGNADSAIASARNQLGAPLAAAGDRVPYGRVYESVVNLHVLHELELVYKAGADTFDALTTTLRSRLDAASPAFRTRESILNMQRTALRMSNIIGHEALLGPMWLETAKIARKAGHGQTAYSAVLRAAQLNAPMTFLQSAKLKHDDQQDQRAIQELGVLFARYADRNGDFDHSQPAPPNSLPISKAALLCARWKDESGRFAGREVVNNFRLAAWLAREYESSFYYLGRYYDELLKSGTVGASQETAGQVVGNLHHALKAGTKYIYQALPRIVTLWAEMGDDTQVIAYHKAAKQSGSAVDGSFPGSTRLLASSFNKVHRIVQTATKDLPAYQWLTVYPQLVARINHPHTFVADQIARILALVMARYPQQCLWYIVGSWKSSQKRRAKQCRSVTEKASASSLETSQLVSEATNLVDQLLYLCNYELADRAVITMSANFPSLKNLLPSRLIIPLQSSLILSLPASASEMVTHVPFPPNLPTFKRFNDEITIMSSMQKPRKITVLGSDGRLHPFLLKPKDDLRKDARLMEFNSMINKLLKKDSEGRKRQLHIRTYGVIPLNEDSGLIEWVANVVPMRSILEQRYIAREVPLWHNEIKIMFDEFKTLPPNMGARFTAEILPRFPALFHEWFLDTFPEPSAWLRSRMAFGRTCAVMSMVGFVLGLGDRHGENILFDETSGDLIHVDLNCLFEKGKCFEVGEKVPFRLTQNIVDGLGVTGVEGVFRRACEVTMRILRQNKDSLMSVLEAFVHDPLTEFASSNSDKRRNKADRGDEAERLTRTARTNLKPILAKLTGLRTTHRGDESGTVAASTEAQVESLIKEAMDPTNLAGMYVGWIPYIMIPTRALALRATPRRNFIGNMLATRPNNVVEKQKAQQNSHAHFQHERSPGFNIHYTIIRAGNVLLTVALLNGMVNVANNKKHVFTPCWQNFTK